MIISNNKFVMINVVSGKIDFRGFTLTHKEASDKLAKRWENCFLQARVVELADTPDLGSGAAGLRVQVPSLAEFM